MKRSVLPNGDICASDLKLKEVINVLDGKRLGTITDIEIDIESGRLTAIVVPGTGRFMGFFGRSEDVVIPWEKINKIGLDVILVETPGVSELKHIDR
ncbi:sporulation protein ylmc/ymxh [Lucifera butyrica]|uniref:Sporulation protein ylmc/ymxh n=1 Tax=Lucifera butyrica TaxID=1351585 RepID=A0A498R454_9FIRM|nr:YlmC/YmxH family sporulation protein [Lucifera butyrica]VBB06204.1 sporulation protein ylmc/ymxh [Lucifera butyrica]